MEALLIAQSSPGLASADMLRAKPAGCVFRVAEAQTCYHHDTLPYWPHGHRSTSYTADSPVCGLARCAQACRVLQESSSDDATLAAEALHIAVDFILETANITCASTHAWELPITPPTSKEAPSAKTLSSASAGIPASILNVVLGVIHYKVLKHRDTVVIALLRHL